MTKVDFHNRSEIEDNLLEFTVIVARLYGHWIFCQHKQRKTWEFPGGRREPGESIDDAALRELWEETGTEQADIQPICAYSVTKDSMTSYGMVYYADVISLGALPSDFEMDRIMFSDVLPQLLTYPEIAPNIFRKVQCWMNTQSSTDELWDVYDIHRKHTGRLHRRGELLPAGDYHLVVEVWIQNSSGQFLLTKRSPNKGFPNMWETTGGSVLAGEDSLTAALREAREEMGLKLDPDRGDFLFTLLREDSFKDVWLFRQNVSLEDIILQPEETTDKMYTDRDTILEIREMGKFVPLKHLEQLFDRIC